MKKFKKLTFKTKEEYFKESIRYYRNAQELLKHVKIEYERYLDLKPVREACGTAYLAVLLALDGYFLERGLDKERLPNSTDEYWETLNKHMIHNGKITNAFAIVYELLHIWGYYRGINTVDVVKNGFEKAKLIIETLAKIK